MPDDRMARIRVRAAAHDESIESGRWPTAAQLAARWNLSVTAVYEIPRELLPYKSFGKGARPRRRLCHRITQKRYRTRAAHLSPDFKTAAIAKLTGVFTVPTMEVAP
jgi:hypothetical protein